MKIIRISLFIILVSMIPAAMFSQDQKSVETRVADLLARMPANSNILLVKLMEDMSALGEVGLRKICDQVIPAGAGDDTKNRFAVESFSRYLTANGDEQERQLWEKICIDHAVNSPDNGVKDFFMKQLQLVGGDATVEAMKPFISSQELCEPAIAVMLSAGGERAEIALAESLKDDRLRCAAAVMNALALIGSDMAVPEYIKWASVIDPNIRAAAYNALAVSGSPAALDVLVAAAEKLEYHWELTGAVNALLDYADLLASKGDITTMDKITKRIISKSKDDVQSVKNRIAALGIYTKYHGIDAMRLLYRAAANADPKYRAAAMRFSLDIEGNQVVNNWINYYKRAINAAKPQIIAMLGERGNDLALPLINDELMGDDPAIRREAAFALATIGKYEVVSTLVDYMLRFRSETDQRSAKGALMSVMRNEDLRFLSPVLKTESAPPVRTSLELIAWKKDPAYFDEVFALTSSVNDTIKAAAINALPELSRPENQQKLITLLGSTDNIVMIAGLQKAIGQAASLIDDPGMRSDQLIRSVTATTDPALKTKLIPVLAVTGGQDALDVILKEFENGNPAMRDASFKALLGWRDHSALPAMYSILESGNKTFESPAFNGYISQVISSELNDERKYLLLRKIMPFAISAERKTMIINQMASLNTYQSLFYISGFLDDTETAAAAARAAMYIALPNIDAPVGMYGSMARDILTRATDKLQGSESEYDRELIKKYLDEMSKEAGFKSLFNGKDLTGWQGLVDNPIARSKMRPSELVKRQEAANRLVAENWNVRDGSIWFTGEGNNLCTVEKYGDFEMLVDWKITKGGDSGIYLRGTPQVQIWDTSRTDVGAQVGSGGLYNNQKHPSKPVKVADNPVGEWNTFRIVMVGEMVSVWLNGDLVVDNVIMENYWDRSLPIFPVEQLELQAHGTDLAFRDIFVREISDKEYNLTPEEKAQGFVSLFNGRDLDNWTGDKKSYVVENGTIIVKPGDDSGGNLYTEKEYADFIFRFEFRLTPAANNGLGIRAPLEGDAAYVGMELQILDETAPVYANLAPYQYHGSVYGVIPAKRGFLKPTGEWNYQEVEVRGTHIKVTLNGTVIVDGDIADARDKGTIDGNDHPGLKNTTGHIGFLGHGSELSFRNLRIKDLAAEDNQ